MVVVGKRESNGNGRDVYALDHLHIPGRCKRSRSIEIICPHDLHRTGIPVSLLHGPVCWGLQTSALIVVTDRP